MASRWRARDGRWSNARDNSASQEIASFLTRITTRTGHLPQGSPASTGLANIAFPSGGPQIRALCEARGLDVNLYVDDVAISGKHAGDVMPLVIEITSTTVVTRVYVHPDMSPDAAFGSSRTTTLHVPPELDIRALISSLAGRTPCKPKAAEVEAALNG